MKLFTPLVLIPFILASESPELHNENGDVVFSNVLNIHEEYCVHPEEEPLAPPPVKSDLSPEQLHDDIISLPTEFHRQRIFLTTYKYVVDQLIKHLKSHGAFNQADQSLESLSLVLDYAGWYMMATNAKSGVPGSVVNMMTNDLETIGNVLYAIPREITSYFENWDPANNVDPKSYLPELEQYFEKFTNYLSHCPKLFSLARKTDNKLIMDTLINSITSIVNAVDEAKLPNSLEVDIIKARFIAEVWRRLLHNEEDYSQLLSLEQLSQAASADIKSLENEITKTKLSINTLISGNPSQVVMQECQTAFTTIYNKFTDIIRLLSRTDMPIYMDLVTKRRTLLQLRDVYHQELAISSKKARLAADPKSLLLEADNNLKNLTPALNYLGYNHASNLNVYLKTAQLEALTPLKKGEPIKVCNQYLKLMQLATECADVAGQLSPPPPSTIKELGISMGKVYKRYVTPHLPELHRQSASREGSFLLDDLDLAFKRRRELKSSLNSVKFGENNQK